MSRRDGQTPVFSVTIHDCEVQDFTAGGKGGQHVNRSNTAIRVIHHPSGARGECREERSQLMNKTRAFVRMTETLQFRTWMARKLSSGPSPEERVQADMQPQNLRVEYRRDGRWQPTTDQEVQ
jgi:hypothetical protein